MLAMIQRIAEGRVVIEGEEVARCDGAGLLILLGVTHEDEEHDADLLADKIAKLRIFSDDEGKMNRSLLDVGGGAIVVSNFTLYGAYRRGNRPDYAGSAHPSHAEPLYEYFIRAMKKQVENVTTGRFGTDMKVHMIADGPVTMQLDSNVLRAPRR